MEAQGHLSKHQEEASSSSSASASDTEVKETNPTPIIGAEVFVELAAARGLIKEGKTSKASSDSRQNSSERTHTTPVQAQQGKISISKPARIGEVLKRLQKLQQQEDEGGDMVAEPVFAPAPHQVVDLDFWTSIDFDKEEAGELLPLNKEKRPFISLRFSDLTYTVYERRKSTGRWWPFSRSQRTPSENPSVNGNLIPDGARNNTNNNNNSIDEDGAKHLLQNVSGEAREGEIFAVMGPSGSGKSTLIDALAQRIARESLKGLITLNGEEVSTRLLRSISAYVMQDDLLFPMLTVEETLMFAANVRLPQSHSRQKKADRVRMLLEQLGLQRVSNTIIGDEGRRGISGGERRRVSIGIDIVHDPLLLFLDEPTSGLDSTSAFMVVRTLQKIAQTGSIVLLSVHQPSYRIMGLIDRLLFLAHGQTVYNGPPSQLNSFFAAYGRTVPEHENNTEFALDLIQELQSSSVGITSLVEYSKLWISKQNVAAAEDQVTVDVKTAISVSISRGKLVSSASSAADESKVARYANPWWVELGVITQRSLTNIKRTPELFLMRLGTVIITGAILATIFWKLDHTPKGVHERLGFLAFAISTTFYTCADALPVFLQERYIFLRETRHNAYRKSSYVLANAIIYVPFLGLLSMAFAVTIWWSVGLSGGAAGFGFMFLILWASFWAGNSFVTFLSAIIPNVMLGYTVVVAMLAYFLLLSGFFISRERIPRYWIWLHYLSMIKYPYEAVLVNEFGGGLGECYERGGDILYGTPLEGVGKGALRVVLAILRRALAGGPYAGINESTCIMRGADVLRRVNVGSQMGRWACLGVTVAFGAVFRLLFYLALRRTTPTSRK